MRPAFLLLAVAIAACQRAPSEQKTIARDLTRQLSPSSTGPAVDTAAQRADSQFQTCLYVYDTWEKLRECLVLKNRWSAQEAAHRIAVYKAQLAKTADSLRAIADSLEEVARLARLEQQRQAAVAAVAERRRQDSLYKATHKERLNGPEVAPGPEALPWMLDTRTKAYYRAECPAAALIPVEARQFYGYQEDVQAKGWPSREPGCR